MLNQKDVVAGQSLDDIRKKKRITKDVEPMMYKMRKNLKTVKGKKADGGQESLELEDINAFSGWKEAFLQTAESATPEQYNDHCWQLQEDLIELRFYTERLHTEIIDEPGQRHMVKLDEELKTREA